MITESAFPIRKRQNKMRTPNAAEKVLLAVSFGTSFKDTRDKTIGAVEAALQKAYPDYEVRRAFTSKIIIGILAKREGIEIDDVDQAMKRLAADGVKEVIVQPTHVMTGFEYNDVAEKAASYQTMFERLVISNPLLVEDADYKSMVTVLSEETKAYDKEDTAVVFMGHGTEHEANAVYVKLQEAFAHAGHSNYIIGTVEAKPSLDDVIVTAKKLGVKKLVLFPLMLVAGDHANNDMAGDKEDSWKNVLTKEGFEVQCVLRGMGEYEGIRQMFISHAAAAISQR